MSNNITSYNDIILCARAATGAVIIVADRRRKCDCCCRSRVVGLAWRLRPDCSCWSRASSAKHGGILAGKTRRARAYARRRRLDTAVDGPRRRTHASPAAVAWPRAPPTDTDHSWCAGGGCGGKYGARAFGAAASHITSRPWPPPASVVDGSSSSSSLAAVADRWRE